LDHRLHDWILSHPETHYFLSVLTIGEIQAGISKLNQEDSQEKRKRMVYEDWLLSELVPRFRDRILQIDEHTSAIWGIMKGEAYRRNRTLPVIDSLLAATAIQHNLILVTENTKDFMETGARLINPFEQMSVPL
jgi:hypothetical protein